MEVLIDKIGINTCFLIVFSVMIFLFILLIVELVKISKLKKKCNNFIRKFGKGKTIEEDLEKFMDRVNEVEEQNTQILKQITNINSDLIKCVQKVGIVRYNAFKDTGSNLSFALALLDQNNDGVVLNGIYSREISNIYAKPVEKGKATYTVSKEEEEAIEKAINVNGIEI